MNEAKLARFVAEGIKDGSSLLLCQSKKDAEKLLETVRKRLPKHRDVTIIQHDNEFLLNIYSWSVEK